MKRFEYADSDDFLLTIYRRTAEVNGEDAVRVTPQDNSLNISRNNGLTPQDTPQVIRVLRVLGEEERSKQEIMEVLVLSDTKNFKEMYLQPALASGLIEMTIPDKPTSRNQKYRKTKLGKEIQL